MDALAAAAAAEQDRDARTFWVTLDKMLVKELCTLCDKYNVSKMRTLESSKRAKKATLVARLMLIPDVATRNRDLLAEAQQRKKNAAALRKEKRSREIWDPETGQLKTLQFCISRSGGRDVTERIWRSFNEFATQNFHDIASSYESAPYSDQPHLHVQACGDVRLKEDTEKARRVIVKRVRDFCEIPPNQGYTVSVLALNRNGGTGQTKSRGIGYVCKEFQNERFRCYVHNMKPTFLQACFNDYLSCSSANLYHGKTIRKDRLMEDLSNFYFSKELGPLQLPIELVYIKCLEDGGNLHWAFATTNRDKPYDARKLNALFSINNRPRPTLFCRKTALWLAFESSWMPSPNVTDLTDLDEDRAWFYGSAERNAKYKRAATKTAWKPKVGMLNPYWEKMDKPLKWFQELAVAARQNREEYNPGAWGEAFYLDPSAPLLDDEDRPVRTTELPFAAKFSFSEATVLDEDDADDVPPAVEEHAVIRALRTRNLNQSIASGLIATGGVGKRRRGSNSEDLNAAAPAAGSGSVSDVPAPPSPASLDRPWKRARSKFPNVSGAAMMSSGASSSSSCSSSSSSSSSAAAADPRASGFTGYVVDRAGCADVKAFYAKHRRHSGASLDLDK